MDRIPRKDKEFTAETRRNAEKTLKEIKSSKTQKVLKTLDCEGHKDLLLISSLRSEMAKDDALLAKFSAKKSLSSQRFFVSLRFVWSQFLLRLCRGKVSASLRNGEAT